MKLVRIMKTSRMKTTWDPSSKSGSADFFQYLLMSWSEDGKIEEEKKSSSEREKG